MTSSDRFYIKKIDTETEGKLKIGAGANVSPSTASTLSLNINWANPSLIQREALRNLEYAYMTHTRADVFYSSENDDDAKLEGVDITWNDE